MRFARALFLMMVTGWLAVLTASCATHAPEFADSEARRQFNKLRMVTQMENVQSLSFRIVEVDANWKKFPESDKTKRYGALIRMKRLENGKIAYRIDNSGAGSEPPLIGDGITMPENTAFAANYFMNFGKIFSHAAWNMENGVLELTVRPEYSLFSFDKIKIKSDEAGNIVKVYFSDYFTETFSGFKDFGGVVLPTRSVTHQDGDPGFYFTYPDTQINPVFPEDTFVIPEKSTESNKTQTKDRSNP